ncbi:hypothetical protein AB432_009005 [Brevibacillus brevis]|uniref:AP2-like integrase N-terminal domain-containing protein n=1 Tax=Brevibacillus brevis TaxID=1393 RepID=A0A2Z4MFH4_BREBE|nr:hypothetical protein AB432_009005 [Brevibacillus brevis]
MCLNALFLCTRKRITKRGFRTKKEAEKAMVEAQAALQKVSMSNGVISWFRI